MKTISWLSVLVLLSTATAVDTNTTTCDWKWVIEKTIRLSSSQGDTPLKIQSIEDNTIRCAGNPPTLTKFKQAVSTARIRITTGDDDVYRFATEMRKYGWPQEEPIYKLSWVNATVHSSISGDFEIEDGEVLCVVVSATDSNGKVIRWEGWNINLKPPYELGEERNIYIDPTTQATSVVDTIEVDSYSLAAI